MDLKPYYKQDGIMIFNADCREVLPELPLNYIDLVLTDPPYGIDYITNWREKDDKVRKRIDNDKDVLAIADITYWLNKLLKNDRHAYVFASPRKIHEVYPYLNEIGDGVKHIIAWDKGDRGTVGDLKCGFGEAWEALFFCAKGRRELNGSRPRTVFRYDWSGALDPLHPTAKPVNLLAKLIGISSNPGEIVFDPFMGSGTTLAAAKNMGRKAIGIELSKDYCDTAVKRLSQETLFK